MPRDTSTFGSFRPRGIVAGLVALSRGSSSRWLGMRYAFLLRSLGLKLLRGRPIDIETLGVRMRLHPAHNNAEKRLAFTPQYFDPDERAYLTRNLPADPVFLDIGADVGGYALSVAAGAGPRARILAIEPQPEIFERLIYNISQNTLPTIKALACAVADADGPITLFVNPTNSGETSMRTVNVHAKGRQLTVQARSLAGVVADERLPRIDAMKVDVEGAEDLVLEPFFRDAPKALWPTILIVEETPSRWGADLHGMLERCGYRAARRTRTNVIYQRG